MHAWKLDFPPYKCYTSFYSVETKEQAMPKLESWLRRMDDCVDRNIFPFSCGVLFGVTVFMVRFI